MSKLSTPIKGKKSLTHMCVHTHKVKKIKKNLEMEDCKVVAKIPNNLNIRYSLLPMPSAPYDVLDPLIDEICKYGVKSKRTIVFCRSYDTLLQMYEYTVLKLNERGALFVGTP